MKKYIANKPCNFGGKRYYIGDEVPTDAVLPEREAALLKYGTIAVVNVPDPKPEPPATPPEGTQTSSEPPQVPGAEGTDNEPPATPDSEKPAAEGAQNEKDKAGKKGQQGK